MKTLIQALQVLSIVTVLTIALGIAYVANTQEVTESPPAQSQLVQEQPNPSDTPVVDVPECPNQMC